VENLASPIYLDLAGSFGMWAKKYPIAGFLASVEYAGEKDPGTFAPISYFSLDFGWLLLLSKLNSENNAVIID
jgi:hypothetical protein